MGEEEGKGQLSHDSWQDLVPNNGEEKGSDGYKKAINLRKAFLNFNVVLVKITLNTIFCSCK